MWKLSLKCVSTLSGLSRLEEVGTDRDGQLQRFGANGQLHVPSQEPSVSAGIPLLAGMADSSTSPSFPTSSSRESLAYNAFPPCRCGLPRISGEPAGEGLFLRHLAWKVIMLNTR